MQKSRVSLTAMFLGYKPILFLYNSVICSKSSYLTKLLRMFASNVYQTRNLQACKLLFRSIAFLVAGWLVSAVIYGINKCSKFCLSLASVHVLQTSNVHTCAVLFPR